MTTAFAKRLITKRLTCWLSNRPTQMQINPYRRKVSHIRCKIVILFSPNVKSRLHMVYSPISFFFFSHNLCVLLLISFLVDAMGATILRTYSLRPWANTIMIMQLSCSHSRSRKSLFFYIVIALWWLISIGQVSGVDHPEWIPSRSYNQTMKRRKLASKKDKKKALRPWSHESTK